MKGTLVAFRLYRHTDAQTVNRFCQKFYGQDTYSHGRKYFHHKRGFLENIPHVRLIRGVLIVAKHDAGRVIRFLREFNAEIHVREVTLTREDRRALKLGD